MSQRSSIFASMALALVWGGGVLTFGMSLDLPIFSFTWLLALAFLGPGLVLAMLICRVSLHRLAEPDFIEGGSFTGAAAIDQRVLQSTVEQLVLALALWPVAGHLLATEGPGVVLALGIGFALARIAHWVGFHHSKPLRVFGSAASFVPTLMVLIWSVAWWGLM